MPNTTIRKWTPKAISTAWGKALVYNLLATAFPSPGFIVGDLVAERTPLAEGMAEEIAAAGAEVAIATNYWVLAVHVGLLLYALKRHTDRAVGKPV